MLATSSPCAFTWTSVSLVSSVTYTWMGSMSALLLGEAAKVVVHVHERALEHGRARLVEAVARWHPQPLHERVVLVRVVREALHGLGLARHVEQRVEAVVAERHQLAAHERVDVLATLATHA